MHGSYEQKDFTFYELRPLRALLPTAVNIVGYNDSRNEDNDIFTPKVGIEFKPTDDVMVYVQGSRGFKAGGFNSRPPSIAPAGADALQSFDPETLTSYEVGLKSEWFDRRVRVNAAAFFSKYDDIQITRLTAIAGLRLEENAGDGEVRGGELEITALPLPGLNISASLGYQDFEYTRLAAGVSGIALDNQLPFQSELTGNLGISYAIPLGTAGDLTVRGDYRYSDRYFIDAENTLAVSQAPYDSFDARIAWSPVSGAWELFAQGINLTDEAIVANGVTSPANNSQIVTYKPPRQYSVGVRVNF
jgi:iron complex outermembrane receptor protein